MWCHRCRRPHLNNEGSRSHKSIHLLSSVLSPLPLYVHPYTHLLQPAPKNKTLASAFRYVLPHRLPGEVKVRPFRPSYLLMRDVTNVIRRDVTYVLRDAVHSSYRAYLPVYTLQLKHSVWSRGIQRASKYGFKEGSEGIAKQPILGFLII